MAKAIFETRDKQLIPLDDIQHILPSVVVSSVHTHELTVTGILQSIFGKISASGRIGIHCVKGNGSPLRLNVIVIIMLVA